MKKKIEIAKEVIYNNSSIFRCPICKQKMILQENSLLCRNAHCFDLSKNGYINLLRNPGYSKYNKDLFNARKKILQNDFFKKLIVEIGNFIVKVIKNKQLPDLRILDTGCGEGTNLVSISKFIREKSEINPVGVGIDISKEGIWIAAREYPGYIWCVADLADSPLNDKQFNFILNILSPANYSEFGRLLNDDGFLIKIIPGTFYLQEIRKIFYPKNEKKYPSSEETIKLFRKNFTIIKQQRITYQQKIENNNIPCLIEMTPLSWKFKRNNQEIEGLKFPKINVITVDLIILIGKNNI
jgi:23S rRNA (guanine745-N1)-methyltransferase